MIDLDLSPDALARVTYILSRPMTALQFADAYWPDRVKRKPGVRSRGGHALLNVLIHKGLVRRKKSDKPDIPDTFIHATYTRATEEQQAARSHVLEEKAARDILPSRQAVDAIRAQLRPSASYWVLLLCEGERWAWIGPNDRAFEMTQSPAQRARYATRAAALVVLWTFRRDNPERGKNMQLVRVASI